MTLWLNHARRGAHFGFIGCFLFGFGQTQAANPVKTERVIFVSTVGSDLNPGTHERPLATINQAAMLAEAGDTVEILPGNYPLSDIIRPAHSGTQAAPITFHVAKPGSVVIDAGNRVPNYDWDGAFFIDKKNWITLDGLKVINSHWFGFSANSGTGITIRNCSTKNTGGSGIYLNGCSQVKVSHNTIQLAAQAPMSHPLKDTQECLSLSDCVDFELAYNEIFDRMQDNNNGGEGIDTKGSCRDGKVHHNVVHDLVRLGIYADSWDGLLNHIETYANTVYRCSSGIAVACENGGTSRNVRIHDNLVYDCPRVGIRLAGYVKNGPVQDIYVYQNTVVHCGYDGNDWENCALLVESDNPACRNFVVKNNLFANNVNGIRTKNQSFLVLDRNLLFGPTLVTGSNPLISDPLFRDPDKKDFHLKPGSPAIGAVIGDLRSTRDHDDRPRRTPGSLGAFELTSY